jgi:hypothetical protein
MKYFVKYKSGMTEEEIANTVAELNKNESECEIAPEDRYVWTAADVDSDSDMEFWAVDRADLDRQLAEMKIGQELITEVTVLVDDSNEAVSDVTLLAIADTEPTCAHYDWTQDNVVSFARKAIEKYIESQKAKAT